jgi:hypothetical protein
LRETGLFGGALWILPGLSRPGDIARGEPARLRKGLLEESSMVREGEPLRSNKSE